MGKREPHISDIGFSVILPSPDGSGTYMLQHGHAFTNGAHHWSVTWRDGEYHTFSKRLLKQKLKDHAFELIAGKQLIGKPFLRTRFMDVVATEAMMHLSSVNREKDNPINEE